MTLDATLPPTDVRKVLVVDDQSDVREALRLLLKRGGYSTETVASPAEAIRSMTAECYDLVILDMNYASDTTSGLEGLDLLDRLHAQCPAVPIVAMTGWSTIELAVEAMQHGACDFITKPWDNDHLLAVLEKHGKKSGERRVRRSRETELQIARNIQRNFLPKPFFEGCGLELRCVFLPAGEVGGDLYDFFQVDNDTVAFLLGDVSGKGIGAAMLVASLQATIRSQQEFARNPSELLQRVNRMFYRSTLPEHYATLFFGIYQAGSRSIRYVNCGHPSAVLLRANGQPEILESNSIAIGAFEASSFDEQIAWMGPNDRLVLFSDGVSEARVEHGEDDWVIDAICNLGGNSSQSLPNELAAAATSAGEQADDITVMELRVQ
jgi:phosphoserine phosphatase RsbU/P